MILYFRIQKEESSWYQNKWSCALTHKWFYEYRAQQHINTCLSPVHANHNIYLPRSGLSSEQLEVKLALDCIQQCPIPGNFLQEPCCRAVDTGWSKRDTVTNSNNVSTLKSETFSACWHLSPRMEPLHIRTRN